MRALIIFNPVSGARRRGYVDEVQRRMQALGAEVEFSTSTYAGESIVLAREAARSGTIDMLLPAGGDGTIREVATGIWEGAGHGPSPRIGLIPIGTANSLARTLGLAPGLSAPDLARILVDGHVRHVRPGYVEWADGRQIFLESCGAGLDARAVDGVTPGIKRWLGPAAYVLTALWRFVIGPDDKLTFDAGGVRHAGAWVIAARTDYFGGWFRLGIDSAIDARELVIFNIPPQGRMVYLRCLNWLLKGRLAEARGVHRMVLEGVDLQSDGGPVPVNADGDIVCHTPCRIGVAERALDVVVPPAM